MLSSKIQTPVPGIEPRHPFGNQFSRLAHYHYATPASLNKFNSINKLKFL